MEFFNKKEEVLDLQLTEYGKYLLSQGRLKPSYYSFYDDEILYDLSASGMTEAQKNTDRRIRYETPNLKPQSNTTGVETRVNQFLKTVEQNIKRDAINSNSINFADAFQSVPQFDQKFFVATDPLGMSDLTSQYDPAWDIQMMHNEIVSAESYYTVNLTSSAATLNDGVIKQIPQIDITMDYKMFYTDSPDSDHFNRVLQRVTPDGINIAVEKNYILIDLHERNTLYEKDNFYFEVYLSGADTGLTELCTHDTDTAWKSQPSKDQWTYYLDIKVDGELDRDEQAYWGIHRRAIEWDEPLNPGCIPPPDPLCPDGTPPPCDGLCPDGSPPPCHDELCPDGSPPPCTREDECLPGIPFGDPRCKDGTCDEDPDSKVPCWEITQRGCE